MRSRGSDGDPFGKNPTIILSISLALYFTIAENEEDPLFFPKPSEYRTGQARRQRRFAAGGV